MITYKVRRTLDGKFARNQGGYYNYEHCGWGVGQVYSEKGFLSARRLFNNVGAGHRNWKTNVMSPSHYDKIELVKYGPGGEVVVWTGSVCKLTAEEAKKFEPTGKAEPTMLARQAGIRDEIGPLLDQIDDAEASFDAGKTYDIGKLYADIETKEFKLRVALEELAARNEKLRGKVRSIIEG